ncbi:MAG: PilW family protein [Deltaproteobacteria bacterium]|nr:PilW family protein [Deltaproteobacteria bacterium]
MSSENHDQAGFTLVELMIALTIFSFVIAGVLAVAVSTTQGYREQRQTIAAESAARVPIDFIADALRQASPGVPDPTRMQDGITCVSGALTVTNNSGGLGPDKLDVIYASGAVVTSTQAAYTTGTTSLAVTDASSLSVGDFIVITNFDQGTLLKISAISTNTLTLNTQCGTISLPSGGYAAGSLVVRAQHATFYIGTQDGIPTLFMDPDSDANATMPAEPLAEGIEDLQVALGVDSGTDGVSENGAGANDDEWQYNFSGDSVLAGTLRAVRVTLVSRAAQVVSGGITPYSRPAIEDHAAGGADAYKRRVLRTIVEIRNTGVSP